MNNNIEEDYVSFEVAKLLKEKGFDCNCDLFMKEGEDDQHPTYGHNSMHGNIRVYIPRHALAIKWIRENFHIHIGIHYNNSPDMSGKQYRYIVTSRHTTYSDESYLTFEETTEVALLYILQNLIQLQQ